MADVRNGIWRERENGRVHIRQFASKGIARPARRWEFGLPTVGMSRDLTAAIHTCRVIVWIIYDVFGSEKGELRYPPRNPWRLAGDGPAVSRTISSAPRIVHDFRSIGLEVFLLAESTRTILQENRKWLGSLQRRCYKCCNTPLVLKVSIWARVSLGIKGQSFQSGLLYRRQGFSQYRNLAASLSALDC
jgi:hypothetical protein